MMNVPIIRLEIEGMKYTLQTALSEHSAQIDKDVQAAIERFCRPENIQEHINRAVKQSLGVVLAEEIERHFKYGEGREAIRQAVRTALGHGGEP